MESHEVSQRTDYPSVRLFSLDVLRGLDMLLLTVVGPLTLAAQQGWQCFSPAFVRQFDHGWQGFTLWDIIMPLFIFMCGAAMPFALGGRLQKGCGAFWRHVLARLALLWFCGGLVQGEWLTLDPQKVTPFSNTLQSIAVGYLAVAAVMTFGSRMLMVVVPIVLVAGYTLLLALFGDYSQFGNAAFKADQWVFRQVLPPSSHWIVNPSHYTWFLTSLMFAAMTFAGYHATLVLRSARRDWRKAAVLGAYGVALFGIGLVAAVWIPVIKPIFTVSFTLQAMGWCVLLLDVLYVLTDILKWRKGLSLPILFGQFSLTAYMVTHEPFRPALRAMAESLTRGCPQVFGDCAQPFVIALCSAIFVVLVLQVRKRLSDATVKRTGNV